MDKLNQYLCKTMIKQHGIIKMATVKTTTVTQTANETLGTKEKKLYYLIIETKKGKLVINVGEKTHEEVNKLTIEEPKDPIDDPRNKAAAPPAAGGKK